MIFIDSNIPMYLVGASHPNKDAAEEALRRLIEDQRRLVTDVEVFQEILHRYTAIDRRDAIPPAFAALQGLIDEIYPIDFADVDLARRLVLESETLSARDAIHVALMRREGLSRILTFDRGFDSIQGIERIPAA